MAELHIAAGNDGKQWKEVTAVTNTNPNGAEGHTIDLRASFEVKARYLQLTVKRARGCERVLLAELHLEGPDTAPEPRAEPAAAPEPVSVSAAASPEPRSFAVELIGGALIRARVAP